MCSAWENKCSSVFFRSHASSNLAQSQLQGLRETSAKLTSERDGSKKELETVTNDLEEKKKTIAQVKKIARRYKTQFEELKVQHDKVGLRDGVGSITHLDLGTLALNLNLNHYFYHLTVEK